MKVGRQKISFGIFNKKNLRAREHALTLLPLVCLDPDFDVTPNNTTSWKRRKEAFDNRKAIYANSAAYIAQIYLLK